MFVDPVPEPEPMEMTVKTKIEIKTELAGLVARKVELTESRLAIKRIPFKERTSEQHREMLCLGSDASDVKDLIRHVQLAYAFVRGMPYWKQERHAKDKPSVYRLAADAGVEREVIEAWLSATPDEVALAAHDAHETESKLRALEARRARGAARRSAA